MVLRNLRAKSGFQRACELSSSDAMYRSRLGHDLPFRNSAQGQMSHTGCEYRNGICFEHCYQINFSPNWIWRDVVEVLVMAPAVPEVFVPEVDDVKVIKFGVLKFARLSRLKISARNCSANRSCSVVVLNAEKSQVARPGPINVFRPKLP